MLQVFYFKYTKKRYGEGIPLELVNEVAGTRLVIGRRGIVIEHQFNELLLSQHRREVGHGQDEIALEHRAQALEQTAALFINGGWPSGSARNTTLGVIRGRPANSVNVDHPAIAKAGKGLVDPHETSSRCSSVLLALSSPLYNQDAMSEPFLPTITPSSTTAA